MSSCRPLLSLETPNIVHFSRKQGHQIVLLELDSNIPFSGGRLYDKNNVHQKWHVSAAVFK